MLKYKTFILFGVIIMLLGLFGCSIDITEENSAKMYSRTDTKYMSESTSFGKGKSDDIYVALNFIYSDETIQKKHGSDFEITADDITCHSSEGKIYGLYRLYSAQAEYSFSIDNTIYNLKLSKSLFGTWTVTEKTECKTEDGSLS
ncbi:MAG: hypothetical protein E7679_06795 [Ruminococcaceae bacterium]|nr:hypothetical protein [Oscillospiraceae bacterium]